VSVRCVAAPDSGRAPSWRLRTPGGIGSLSAAVRSVPLGELTFSIQGLMGNPLPVCYDVCNMSSKLIHNAHIDGTERGARLDALYTIAESRAGYFTASQAAEAGYSRSALAYHAKAGMLDRIEHGIYRLRRFPESPRADLIVAALRVGPGGPVSHESALQLYGLSDVLPMEIHVTVPRTASRRRRGLVLHTGRLETEEVTTRDGIPVTTVERTITDVARSGLPERLVFQAIDQAIERGLTLPARLAEYAGRRGGRARTLVSRALNEEPA
jgi:predicted transcriptional regulator of viral defense system